MYRRGMPSALVKQLGNLHMAVRPLRKALYVRLRRQGLLKHPAVREGFPYWEWDPQPVQPVQPASEGASLEEESGFAVRPVGAGSSSGGAAAARKGRVLWDEPIIEVAPLELDPEVQRLDALLDRPDDAMAEMFPRPWPARPAGTSGVAYRNHLYAVSAGLGHGATSRREGRGFTCALLCAALKLMLLVLSLQVACMRACMRKSACRQLTVGACAVAARTHT